MKIEEERKMLDNFHMVAKEMIMTHNFSWK